MYNYSLNQALAWRSAQDMRSIWPQSRSRRNTSANHLSMSGWLSVCNGGVMVVGAHAGWGIVICMHTNVYKLYI